MMMLKAKNNRITLSSASEDYAEGVLLHEAMAAKDLMAMEDSLKRNPKGMYRHDEGLKNALLKAIDLDDMHMLDLFLKYDADVNAKGVLHISPLQYSVSHGSMTCVERLLAHGGDASQVTLSGFDAIHLAIAKGNTDLIDLLWRHHPTINRVKKFRKYLVFSVGGNLDVQASESVMKCLLRYGIRDQEISEAIASTQLRELKECEEFLTGYQLAQSEQALFEEIAAASSNQSPDPKEKRSKRSNLRI